MGKRTISLYIDDETVEMAKLQHINMSSLFREMLKGAIKPKGTQTKEEEIAFLTLELAKAESENIKLKEQIKQMEEKENDRKRRNFRVISQG